MSRQLKSDHRAIANVLKATVLAFLVLIASWFVLAEPADIAKQIPETSRE